MLRLARKVDERKFKLAAAAMIFVNLQQLVGTLTPAIYGAIMGTIITAYIAGNVAQKWLVPPQPADDPAAPVEP